MSAQTLDPCQMPLAPTLAAINPRVGGVLLTGPKGTGKTTLVRAAGELLPVLERATCAYGCDPQGSNLCAQCAELRERGAKVPARKLRGEIVELPANAQLDDVVGAVDLRAALERSSVASRPGLLADVVVDALLDAASCTSSAVSTRSITPRASPWWER